MYRKIKNIVLCTFLMLFSINCLSQEKKDIVFLFNKMDTVSSYKKDDIYFIKDLGMDFKPDRSFDSKTVRYKRIKKDLYSIGKFEKEFEGKVFLDHYRKYNLYLFIPENNDHGKLIRVEINNVYIFDDDPIED